jgi:DinB superfamily
MLQEADLMPLDEAAREALVSKYAEGPARLRAVWVSVPEGARQWRPATGKWSAHEIVVHCADSETNAAQRIRYLLSEKDTIIVGYDQEAWARDFDYHAHPVELALQTIEAVRANTTALLRRLPAAVWSKAGRHSEHGRYSAEDWLLSYAAHVHNHSAQIERNLLAWQKTPG